MPATMTAPQPGEWLTIGVAARRLGVSVTTMRRLAKSGRLTVREIPGSWPRVPSAEVDEILDSSTCPRTTQ
jgi:excisionase family DNA binding protein